MTNGPLDGLTVVDLSTTPAGAWCSRLLAGYGAYVIAVEPVTGNRLHSLAPFDDAGASIPADYWLANKDILTFDFDEPAELEGLRAIAAWEADVVVSTFTPSEAAALGLDYASLAAPGMVMTHVTPWGYNGPLAEVPGNDLAVAARSGWASINGLAGKAPLKPNGWLCSYYGGVSAFTATLAALYERTQSGHGQEVDVAVLDAMLVGFAPAFSRAQYTGTGVQRPAQPDMLTGPVPVKDGHFALTISRAHFWRDAMNLLGLPDLAEDPRWEASWYRAAHKDEYVGRVQERMGQWTKAELFEELAVRRVVAGPVLTMAELFENEHLRERGFWDGAEDDDDKLFAGAPAKFSRTPWQPAKPAKWTNVVDGRATPHADSADPPAGKPPLAGLRGIVLTQAWAGTLCTEMLAMLGADVIQVEVRKRLDSWRGAVDAPLPARVEGQRPEQHPWNCNFLYNSVNLNKRCITLDLQTEEGKQTFLDLLPHADFVAENFSPRVMGNLGLSYEELRRINPRVVLCSLSAYGHEGPWANIPGIGGTIEPTAGISALLGYEGGGPLNSGQMFPDAVAGMYGAASIVAALVERETSGEGQFIDISMQESNLGLAGDAALEFLRTGVQRARVGNHHSTFAPHGMYRCAGGESWLALACESDEQWQSLCTALGYTGWAPDPRFATAAARKANERALDSLLSAAVAQHEREDLLAALAGTEVIAAPVHDAFDIAAEPRHRERGVIAEVDHAEAGAFPVITHPFRFSRSATPTPKAAPLHGEHGLEVLADLLGMTEARYAELVAAGISGMGPPA